MQKRVHPARRIFRFGRQIRVGLNKTAYATLVQLSLDSQRSRQDIIRAVARDYIANQRPYEGCIVNQKRPHTALAKLSDDAVNFFADKAYYHDNCHGYGRFLGSIVERYFNRFRYWDLVEVFRAYADVLVPILKETSNAR